jgi:hypothetical protein
MKIIRHYKDQYFLEIEEIAERERPPMMSIPEYRDLHRERFADD